MTAAGICQVPTVIDSVLKLAHHYNHWGHHTHVLQAQLHFLLFMDSGLSCGNNVVSSLEISLRDSCQPFVCACHYYNLANGKVAVVPALQTMLQCLNLLHEQALFSDTPMSLAVMPILLAAILIQQHMMDH